MDPSTWAETIEIVLDEGEVLEIDLSDLSQNDKMVSELLGVLNSERVSSSYYLRIALECWKRQLSGPYELFMTHGLKVARERRDKSLIVFLNVKAYELIVKAKYSKASRAESLEQAASHLRDADSIASNDPLTLLVKATLLLARDDLDQGVILYENLLRRLPDSFPALMGKGTALYRKKDYKAALTAFQKALRLYPDCRYPDPRLGIALCYSKLPSFGEQARQAFDRILELDPHSTGAMTCLIQMDLNAFKISKTPENRIRHLDAAMARLKIVLGLDPRNPVINLIRAQQAFARGNLDDSIVMSNLAFTQSNSSNLSAQAAYIAGRAHQLKGSYDKALQNFTRAAQLDPENVRILFALAQLQVWKYQSMKSDVRGIAQSTTLLTQAIENLEKALRKNPMDLPTLKFLVSLYSETTDQREKALEKWEAIKRIMKKRNPDAEDFDLVDDPDLCLEMGKIFEALGDIRTSLKAYERAYKLLERLVDVVPQELENNIGALFHTLGHLDNATKWYQKAGASLQKQDLDFARFDSIVSTIAYNEARAREDCGEPEDAAGRYKIILGKHPRYLDALLRLGAIEQAAGHDAEAINYYNTVIELTGEKNVEAFLMLAEIQRTGNPRQSRKTLEKVIKDVEKNESYALVQLGNALLATAKANPDKSRRADDYTNAVMCFHKALIQDPKDTYAAHGVAIALAENDHLLEAKDILLQIREANPSMCWVWMNLAHCMLELGQVEQAIVLYDSCMQKFSETRDSQGLQSLSRAYYIQGRQDKSLDALHKALDAIREAKTMEGDDVHPDLIYNEALILQALASLLSELPPEQKTLAQLKQAMMDLDVAKQGFASLISRQGAGNLHQDASKLPSRVESCETLKETLEKQSQEQSVYEAEHAEQIAKIGQERLAEEEARQAKKLEELRRKEEEELALIEMRRRAKEQLMESQQRLDKESGKAKRGKKEKAPASGSESESNKKRKRTRKSKSKKSSRRRRDDSEEDYRGRTVGKKSNLSKDVISEESASSEMEGSASPKKSPSKSPRPMSQSPERAMSVDSGRSISQSPRSSPEPTPKKRLQRDRASRTPTPASPKGSPPPDSQPKRVNRILDSDDE